LARALDIIQMEHFQHLTVLALRIGIVILLIFTFHPFWFKRFGTCASHNTNVDGFSNLHFTRYKTNFFGLPAFMEALTDGSLLDDLAFAGLQPQYKHRCTINEFQTIFQQMNCLLLAIFPSKIQFHHSLASPYYYL
jgi:hypothetical protein